MSTSDISRLMNQLSIVHTQIGELRRRVQRLQDIVERCAIVLDSSKNALKEKLKVKSELLLLISQKERESEAALQEVTRRKEQLNLAKSNREYEALKLQIQIEEKKNDELADSTLLALGEVDGVEEAVKLAEEDVKKAEENLKKSRENLAVFSPALESDIEKALVRLHEAESNLPHDWAGVYSRCVSRFGGEEALSRLVDGEYCDSCNTQLPLDFVAQVQAGKGITCPSCGRLLYNP